MSLVLMATHGWGTLFINPDDIEAGVGLQSSFTNPADATAVTHYADDAGASPSTGPVTADPDGRLMRWVEEGTYDQELPGGSILEVQAVSGSTTGAAGISINNLPVNVRDHGATGLGAVDDLAGLAAANTLAAAEGRTLLVPIGTYLVSAQWTPSVSVRFEPGAVIKKMATFSGAQAIRVSAANVTFDGLTLEGNRAAGALGRGLYWTGAGGVLRNSLVKSNKSGGVFVDGGQLDCYAVTSSDNVGGTGTTLGSVDGFFCQGGRLRLFGDCKGSDNDRAGIFFLEGSSAGCRLEGTFEHNFTGVILRSSNGIGGRIVLNENRDFGMQVGSSSLAVSQQKWQFEYIEHKDTGVAFTSAGGASVPASSGAATGLEFYGASHNKVGTLIGRRPLGYGLAITREDGTNVGSNDNAFGLVDLDGTDAADSDPGIHISGNSVDNRIGTALVTGHSFAVTFGEDVAGNPQHNSIGTLIATRCAYGIVSCRKGSYNYVGPIVSRDCYNVSGTWPALLTFDSSASVGNVAGPIDHRSINNPYPTGMFLETTGAVDNKMIASNRAFSPSDIAGLLSWYRSDSIVGLSDGNPISTWPDSSGNTHDLVGVSGARPLFKTAIQNGHAAVLFDGTDDKLVAGSSIASLQHVFAVAKYTAATFNAYDGLVTGVNASDGDNVLLGQGASTQFYNTDPPGTTYHKDGTSLPEAGMTGPMNAWAVMSISAPTGINGFSNPLTVQLGYDRVTAARVWDGYIGEVLCFSRVLTTAERQAVEAYLKAKWATP